MQPSPPSPAALQAANAAGPFANVNLPALPGAPAGFWQGGNAQYQVTVTLQNNVGGCVGVSGAQYNFRGATLPAPSATLNFTDGANLLPVTLPSTFTTALPEIGYAANFPISNIIGVITNVELRVIEVNCTNGNLIGQAGWTRTYSNPSGNPSSVVSGSLLAVLDNPANGIGLDLPMNHFQTNANRCYYTEITLTNACGGSIVRGYFSPSANQARLAEEDGHEAAEFANVAPIAIFPNPTKDVVFITGLDEAHAYTIRVTSMDGRLAQTGESTGNDAASIDLTRLPAGMYSVQVTTGDAIVKTARILRNQ